MQSLSTLLLCACLLLPTAVVAQNSAGKTIMARGQVNATADQQVRQLQRRSPVFGADVVNTGADSVTQLRMIDGGLLSVQPQSELVIAKYDFNPDNDSGSVVMSLLKGGLRTVTGVLHTADNHYRLNTPVASIGVRGTHYEVEIDKGDVYLAGWQGIIDIQVSVPGKAKQFSLGPEQSYRFAVVRANGDVEYMLKIPPAFTQGFSNLLLDDMSLSAPTPDLLAMNFSADTARPDMQQPNNDYSGKEFIDNDRLVANWIPDTLDGLDRTGSVTLNNLVDNSFSSSNGPLSNLAMSMQINLDTARVPTGNLSFSDNGGEWFAAFNGFVGEKALDLNINFASHGNNLADGSLSGLLLNGASAVLGDLNLHELNDANTKVDGTFLLTEKQP